MTKTNSVIYITKLVKVILICFLINSCTSDDDNSTNLIEPVTDLDLTIKYMSPNEVITKHAQLEGVFKQLTTKHNDTAFLNPPIKLLTQGDYQSYTILVSNDTDLVQNLVLTLKEDSTYNAFLVSYYMTQDEITLFQNGTLENLHSKINITKLDPSSEILSTFNRNRSNCYEEVTGISNGTGWEIIEWEEVDCEPTDSGGGGDSGGGSDPGNQWGGNNTGQNTSGQSSGGGNGGSAAGGSSPTNLTSPIFSAFGQNIDELNNILNQNLNHTELNWASLHLQEVQELLQWLRVRPKLNVNFEEARVSKLVFDINQYLDTDLTYQEVLEDLEFIEEYLEILENGGDLNEFLEELGNRKLLKELLEEPSFQSTLSILETASIATVNKKEKLYAGIRNTEGETTFSFVGESAVNGAEVNIQNPITSPIISLFHNHYAGPSNQGNLLPTFSPADISNIFSLATNLIQDPDDFNLLLVTPLQDLQAVMITNREIFNEKLTLYHNGIEALIVLLGLEYEKDQIQSNTNSAFAASILNNILSDYGLSVYQLNEDTGKWFKP